MSYFVPCSYKDQERIMDKLSVDLNDFFCDLEDNTLQNVEGLNYREAQQDYALAIMKAIKEKKILLIEAGVGTGKSFGYLLPIFYTMNGIHTFDKVIISTSSIGLQEQIMKDIDFISNMLKTPVKAWLAKGMNNYACMRRIDELYLAAQNQKDKKTLQILNELKKEIYKQQSCDKAQLQKIDGTLWQKIQVCGGCDKCSYNVNQCPYKSISHHILNMPIIVTNHTYLANMLKNKHDIISSSSLVVIDEAHNFEDEVRLVTENRISLSELQRKIHTVKYKFADKNDLYEEENLIKLMDNLNNAIIKNFAVTLRANSTVAQKRQEKESGIVFDDKIPFNISSKPIQRSLLLLTKELLNLINFLTKCNKRYIAGELKYFKECLQVFLDMLKDNPENIYWSKLISGNNMQEVELFYSKKNITPLLNNLYRDNKTVVMTSATMDTGNKDYAYIKKSLGLENNNRVMIEEPLESPFDYENNSLFYYADDIISPKSKNREEYLVQLANRLKDVIAMTEGKALILFTSKQDMIEVYNIMKNMKLDLNLILQEDKDVKKCKTAFTLHEDSCLFATGAFWEGIDIKGKTLSNLVIVRLPFPVQDRIVEYKKENLTQEEAIEIDTNEMITKLAQGAGRLIRTKKDKGIVCCLDSRITTYLDQIQKALPFKKYTNNLEEAKSFTDEKILEKEKNEKVLTLSQN